MSIAALVVIALLCLNRRMAKLFHLYSGLLLSSKEEQTTDMFNNISMSQEYYAKWKSLIQKSACCLISIQEVLKQAKLINNQVRVLSLGQEDPLEWEMATHSSILAWKIPWTEEPGRLQSTGLQRVRHTEQLTLLLSAAKDVIACVIITDTLSQSGAMEALH